MILMARSNRLILAEKKKNFTFFLCKCKIREILLIVAFLPMKEKRDTVPFAMNSTSLFVLFLPIMPLQT